MEYSALFAAAFHPAYRMADLYRHLLKNPEYFRAIIFIIISISGVKRKIMMEDRYIKFSLTVEQLAKNLQKLKNARMAEFGLRSVHVTCIVRLGQTVEGLTSAQLSEACDVDKSLVSRVIGELQEKGFVTYEVCDKIYRRRIQLTESGMEVFYSLRHIIYEAVDAVRGTISDRDVEVFYSVLNYFDRNICELIKEKKTKAKQ